MRLVEPMGQSRRVEQARVLRLSLGQQVFEVRGMPVHRLVQQPPMLQR